MLVLAQIVELLAWWLALSCVVTPLIGRFLADSDRRGR